MLLKLISNSSSLNKGNHDCDDVWRSQPLEVKLELNNKDNLLTS